MKTYCIIVVLLIIIYYLWNQTNEKYKNSNHMQTETHI